MSTVSFSVDPQQKSIYEFVATSIDGDPIPFKQFEGKYILIVNTASKCGFTRQYQNLELLHQYYPEKVVVLGFPSDNFMNQEFSTNVEIKKFCKEEYNITFPLFEKIDVKGKNAHPVFTWLFEQTGKKPSWNFCKYFINPDGKTVQFFSSEIKPFDKAIISKLEAQ